MGLRLREGIDPAATRRFTGRSLDESRIRDLEGDGLIAPRPDAAARRDAGGFPGAGRGGGGSGGLKAATCAAP